MSVWPVVTEPIRGPEPVTPEPALPTATPPPPIRTRFGRISAFAFVNVCSPFQLFSNSTPPLLRNVLHQPDWTQHLPRPPSPARRDHRRGSPGSSTGRNSGVYRGNTRILRAQGTAWLAPSRSRPSLPPIPDRWPVPWDEGNLGHLTQAPSGSEPSALSQTQFLESKTVPRIHPRP